MFQENFRGILLDKGPDWVSLNDFQKPSRESLGETQIVPFCACWDAGSGLGGKGGWIDVPWIGLTCP